MLAPWLRLLCSLGHPGIFAKAGTDVSNVEHEANDKKGGKGSPTAIPGLNNAG